MPAPETRFRKSAVVVAIATTCLSGALTFSQTAAQGAPPTAEVDLAKLARGVATLNLTAESVDASPELIASHATQWGVSHAEAERRLALQPAASRLIEHLGQNHADTFAGGWIDEATGRVHVAMSGRSADVRAILARRFPAADLLFVESRATPLTDLEAAATAVRTTLASAAAPGETAAAVSVDQAAGGLVMHQHGAQADAQLERRAREAARGVSVATLKVLAPVTRIACTASRDCQDAPPRGGVGIYSIHNGQRVNLCTTGFISIYYAGPDPDPPQMLTAGHCMIGQDEVFFENGKKLGRFVEKRDNLRDFDIARLDMVAEYENVGFNNGVYRYSTSPNYPIRTTGFAAQGSTVCSTGRTNNHRCGAVLSTNFDGRGTFTVRMCGRSGDSGGPAYNLSNSGLGIASSASNGASTGGCQSGDFVEFVYINPNASQIGSSVYIR